MSVSPRPTGTFEHLFVYEWADISVTLEVMAYVEYDYHGGLVSIVVEPSVMVSDTEQVVDSSVWFGADSKTSLHTILSAHAETLWQDHWAEEDREEAAESQAEGRE